jgi:hypothetical protein
MDPAASRFVSAPSVVICFIAGLAVGCGSSPGTVSGTVSYRGKLLEHGSVTFQAADGFMCQANIGSGGKYEIRNVAPGKVKVAVVSYSSRMHEEMKQFVDQMKQVPSAPGARPGHVGGNPSGRSQYLEIPEVYADLDRSGLVYTVQKGANTFNIELK